MSRTSFGRSVTGSLHAFETANQAHGMVDQHICEQHQCWWSVILPGPTSTMEGGIAIVGSKFQYLLHSRNKESFSVFKLREQKDYSIEKDRSIGGSL